MEQTTPRVAIKPSTTEQLRAQEFVFLAVDEQQKQVQLSEVRIDGVDENAEKLAVNVDRSLAEEKTTTIIGGYVTEEGELHYSAWVFRRLAVFEEQLSLEINKYCNVSPDLSLAAILGSPQYEPSMTEKCCDCLCQAYTCKNLSVLAKRGRKSRVLSKVEHFATDELRKARALGMKTIAATVKDPYTPTCLGALFRDFSVYGYFLLSLAFWINVIVGFTNDLVGDDDPDDDMFHLAKLVISTIGIAISLVDLVYHACVQKCETCKQCSQCVPETQEHFNKNEPLAENSLKSTPNEQPPAAHDETPHKECKCFFAVFDAFRLVLLEMMNYPNLLLSIFQLILQIVNKDGEVELTTYISVIISLLSTLLFVYVARWFVLIGSVYSIQKIRTGGQDFTAKSLRSTSSAWFHIAFVSNAIGHTVVQMLMIVAIASRFHHEIQTDSLVSSYFPSAQLWYMMVFAYVGPFLGLILFLVTCHFWTQQFPIELFLDMLNLLKKPGLLEALRQDKKAEEYSSTMKKLRFYLDEANLREEFESVKKIRLERKLEYPFIGPLHVILCFLYCALLLAFWFCAGINGLNSSEWKIFYATGALFAVFVNGYACAVGIFWIIVFVVAIFLIVQIFPLCILVCLCASCCSVFS